MGVYKVYIWYQGRLEHVAENIVAPSFEAATRRGVQAVCSRDGDKADWLLALFNHVTVGTTAPAGVVVRVAAEDAGAVMVAG